MGIKLDHSNIERARQKLKQRQDTSGILLATPIKCSKSGKEGQLHFQRISEKDWRFVRATASAAGVGQVMPGQLSGDIDWDSAACPHCDSQHLFQCGNCRKMCCYAPTGKPKQQTTCAWCGNTGVLEGVITSLDGAVGGKGKSR
jgi:hypothetical protein